MAKPKVKVEYIHAAGCSRCAEARQTLKDAAQSVGDIEWEEVDVATQPVRAVDLGIVATPAVLINGKLEFSSAPTTAQLIAALKSHLDRS